jgi:clan AA aspartic protease
MGVVYTEITLRNGGDVFNVKQGRIKADEIRQMTVRALVDTGAGSVVINEETRKKLGLEITDRRSGTLADGSRGFYTLAGPLEVVWKDRNTTCDAIVLPSPTNVGAANEVLLGAIPLEGMDLTVNPKRELVGAHGDEIVLMIKYGNATVAATPRV